MKQPVQARDAGIVPATSDGGIPMQTAEWMDARARLTFAGAPAVLSVGDGGHCRARAMLCRTKFGFREMPLMNEPSDFAWEDEAALTELAMRLIAQRRPFFLERLPEESPTLPALRKAAEGRFWLKTEPAPPTPRIDIRGKTINDVVKSGRRSDLRRAGKRLAGSGDVSYELCAPGSKADLATLTDAAFDVETRSWKHEMGTALTSPAEATYAQAFRGFLDAAHDNGHLRFAFLRLDGTAIAMQIASEWRNRYWIYKATFDKAHAKSSPGNLLYFHTLQQAIEQRLEAYEFMGKMDDWTRAWTQDTRDYVKVYGLPYHPRGLVGAAFMARWVGMEKIRERIRSRQENAA